MLHKVYQTAPCRTWYAVRLRLYTTFVLAVRRHAVRVFRRGARTCHTVRAVSILLPYQSEKQRANTIRR